MKRLISALSFGRYRLVDGARTACRRGDMWVENRQTLYIVTDVWQGERFTSMDVFQRDLEPLVVRWVCSAATIGIVAGMAWERWG